MIGRFKRGRHCAGSCLTLSFALAAIHADELPRLIADRTAVERVYYAHRQGTKPTFEEIFPPEFVKAQVRQELKKESVLKARYGNEITLGMIEAEVQRINSSSRSPEVLNELKLALDNDPARFAQTVVKPLLVDRFLRERFENDDKLHAPQRRGVDIIRERLLASRKKEPASDELLQIFKQSSGDQVLEVTWLLGARPSETSLADVRKPMEASDGSRSAQKILPQPNGGGEEEFHFEDLPPRLQEVLRAQLVKTGDISATIEMPNRFNLYLLLEKTPQSIRVAVLTMPKQSYEQWLAKQH